MGHTAVGPGSRDQRLAVCSDRMLAVESRKNTWISFWNKFEFKKFNIYNTSRWVMSPQKISFMDNPEVGESYKWKQRKKEKKAKVRVNNDQITSFLGPREVGEK